MMESNCYIDRTSTLLREELPPLPALRAGVNTPKESSQEFTDRLSRHRRIYANPKVMNGRLEPPLINVCVRTSKGN